MVSWGLKKLRSLKLWTCDVGERDGPRERRDRSPCLPGREADRAGREEERDLCGEDRVEGALAPDRQTESVAARGERGHEVEVCVLEPSPVEEDEGEDQGGGGPRHDEPLAHGESKNETRKRNQPEHRLLRGERDPERDRGQGS